MTVALLAPPSFDAATLRRRYPDLEHMTDAAIRAHYEAFGRAEGRVASDVAERDGLVALVTENAALLEIGPYCNPAFSGPKVSYLDVFDADELRRRAVSAGLDASKCPGLVHFTQGLASVPPASFDFIFSSHALEHQPDMVSHLQEAAEALRPGGAYLLVVPDKRYCFDHHLPMTSINEVMGAYAERRTRHTARNLLDYIVHQTHNDPVAHWRGEHGTTEDPGHERLKWALAHYEEARGDYIDVHAWRLTPNRFREIVEVCVSLGLLPFEHVTIYDTPWGEFQFTAVLQKGLP